MNRTVVLLLVAVALNAPAQSKPKVHIVATGGTIASTNYYSGNAGKITVEALLRAVPQIDSIATISFHQFANVASTALTPDSWLAMSRAISDTLTARPDISGVIVTHGTDTMEETAYFLDLTVADNRPVIVTGAMRPSDGIGIDGPANLYNSVRVASDTNARGRGAMVLLNDEIFAARDVSKANTVRTDAFAAPFRGVLGVADPERIGWYRLPQRLPVFDISKVTALPRVDIAYTYSGADGSAIDAFVAAGAKGIITAGAGRGGVTRGMNEALGRAMAKGVIVISSSRTGSGSVPVGTGVRRDGRPGSIGAGDLNVQKARVLLMLALTKTSDPKEIAKIFAERQ